MEDIKTTPGNGHNDPKVFLAITIDTEEDDWGCYTHNSFSLDNIQRIPRLQDIFNKYGMLPTYFITYPVATDEISIKILGKIAKEGRCEIGTHPHPWNTPPIEEERNEQNSFINNLPSKLQFEKIRTLHETISRNFQVTPTSYRSGRWGFSDEVAKHLFRLGYLVDSSIMPYTDWSEYHGPDYSLLSAKSHILNHEGSEYESGRNPLIEIPSTVGYLQMDQEASNRLYYRILRRPLKHFSIVGLLNRMKVLNRVWLSPEISNGSNMVKLAETMINNGHHLLNMFFHSSSLLENSNPFVQTAKDLEEFFRRIEMFLAYACDRGIQPIKLYDAGIQIIQNFKDIRSITI